jgi:hypothetical protein
MGIVMLFDKALLGRLGPLGWLVHVSRSRDELTKLPTIITISVGQS